jgi:hypothetical protein
MARYYETPTGIEKKHNSQNIKIYPNPTTDQITVITPDTGVLTITNQLGNEVRKIKIKDEETKILTQDFPNGFYYLTFKNETKYCSIKLIILH